jgi:hypothetical protein
MVRGPRKRSAKKTSRPIAASRPRSQRRRALPRQPHVRALGDFARLAKREKLRWYVFGAQAVNLLGYPRATADLDVTVELGDRTPAQLVRALDRAGFEPRFADPEFIAATRVIPVVHRASGLPVDVVLAGPGLEQQFLDEVVHARLDRHDIPLLSIENLIVTKLIAGRAKDLEDVRELLARAGARVDRNRVVSLLEVVEQALGTSELVALFGRLDRGT